jgi:aminoglycoside 3-N-acetyltransferase I
VTYQQSAPDVAYPGELLAKAHFITVTAKAPVQDVVDGLSACVLDKFEQDRRQTCIWDLAVREAHRRRDIATGRMTALQRIAADLDVDVIFAQADPVDAPAIALCQKLGSKVTAHRLDTPVPPRNIRR